MQTVVVLNTKGGCGKSTIATNLAGYYAASGVQCMLIDYDPQRSSLQWLQARPEHHPPIHGVDGSRTRTGLTRTFQMAVPPGTGRVVIDAPAGVSGLALQEMLRRADVALVPVTPSAIDVHATMQFIRDLVQTGKAPRPGLHLGVVGNRVRRTTAQYESMKAFLAESRIPLVTSLMDSEGYLIAAESGVGIWEMDERETGREREQWLPLLRWLMDPTQSVETREEEEPRPRLNVISMGGG